MTALPPDEDPGATPAASAAATQAPAAATAQQPQPTGPPPEHIPRTRVSATFIALLASLVVLILLLVFILENTRQVAVSYMGATGKLPLGVALLLAAVAGALILAIVGTARILQLRARVRRAARRNR